jgi:hypothetical protein
LQGQQALRRRDTSIQLKKGEGASSTCMKIAFLTGRFSPGVAAEWLSSMIRYAAIPDKLYIGK